MNIEYIKKINKYLRKVAWYCSMYQLFTTYDFMTQNIFLNIPLTNVHQGVVFSAACDSSTWTSTSRTTFITAPLVLFSTWKKISKVIDAILLIVWICYLIIRKVDVVASLKIFQWYL